MGAARPSFRRMLRIVAVLGRRGAASLVATAVLRDGVAAGWRRRLLGSRVQPPARHLRIALEELGATFVKLGQIASTRTDLVPAEYLSELARLQDAEPPELWEAIEAVIAAELGRPASCLYASFDPQPLAAGSIGQAHAAVTFGGEEVVVKVRRPGIVAEVELDLMILARIVHWFSRWTPMGRTHDIEGLTREFSETLRSELDYVREARNAERFAADFADDLQVHIPRVIWPLTTHQVLTLERIRGAKITDPGAVDALPLDRAELARRAARIELRMVFEHGFFHADPHPGNFFIEPDGRIGLIDFGMVGTIDDRTKAGLLRLVASLTAHDGDGMVAALEDLGIAGVVVARQALRSELLALAESHLQQPLGDLSLAALLRDMLAVIRRYRLHLPPNLALLVKTIGMSEGVGAQLDPTFRMINALAPFAVSALSAARR